MTSRQQQLSQLLQSKGQEWQSIVQEHVDSLTKELEGKDKVMSLEKVRFKKLCEDFEFNLKLLQERDADLAKYEKLFEQLKANDDLSKRQVSDMKIRIDEFQTKLTLITKEKEELQRHYQARLKQYQEETNLFYARKEEERASDKNEYEELKRDLQQKIVDAEQEVDFEKQRLLKEMAELVKQKESALQVKLDHSENELHQCQLNVRTLTRDLELARSSNTEALENAESNRGTAMQLGKQLKQKEWELEDVINTKDLRIRELEAKAEQQEKSMAWKAEEFERKYREMEKLSTERENTLSVLHEATDTNEKKLLNDLKSLRQENEELELTLRRLRWQMTDEGVVKAKEIENLKESIACSERKFDEEMERNNKMIVAKDLEIESMKVTEDRLRKDTNSLKTSVEQLKKDFTMATDRERVLENAKVQLELDWRRRYEAKESEVFEKHDHLIRNLEQGKENATNKLKDMQQELNRRENLIKLLEDDKEIALKCLNKNNINTDHLFTDRFPERELIHQDAVVVDDVQALRNKNKQLKEVIAVMRDEMELLSQQITSSTSTPNRAPTKEEKTKYVVDLETEVCDLKVENRKLLLKMEDVTREGKPPAPPHAQGKINVNQLDASVRNYINKLNEAVAALHNEKITLTASLNSKDLSLKHLNESNTNLTNDKERLIVEIDNIMSDMSSRCKVYEHSIGKLKQRISELELQLQQSQCEAEVYFKSVVERNLDSAQLNSNIANLQFQQTSGMPTIQSSDLQQPSRMSTAVDGKSASFYKGKLKLAVERIKELSIERVQLIHVGNKYHAEVAKLKGLSAGGHANDDHCNGHVPQNSNLRDYGNKIQPKLEQLQQLKYEATSAELKDDLRKMKPVEVDLKLNFTDISVISDNCDTNQDIFTIENNAADMGTVAENQNNINMIVNQAGNDKDNYQTTIRTSSEGSSIKEIWKLLENTEEISSIPDRTVGQEIDDGFTLVGKRIDPDKRIVSRPEVTKPTNVGKGKKRTAVRNYNLIKDDR